MLNDAALRKDVRYGELSINTPRDMLTLNIERILSFWARTAPKKPMERIGALLMGIVIIFSTAIILMTIANASTNAWTSSGVAGSAFGICVILLLLPVGLAHFLAAFLPNIFDPWLRKPIGRIEEVKARMTDRMSDMGSSTAQCRKGRLETQGIEKTSKVRILGCLCLNE